MLVSAMHQTHRVTEFHRQADFDEVLRNSMQRRLKNLRDEVEALCNTLHQAEAIPNGHLVIKPLGQQTQCIIGVEKAQGRRTSQLLLAQPCWAGCST